jgi:predicted transposase YbfD/YdcC
MSISFLDWCTGLEDYRVIGMVTYPLAEIVFAAFVGVICGGDDWEDIALIAAEKQDFLRGFLPYENGVASEQMMRRCFRQMEARGFQDGFTAWVAGLTQGLSGVVAIDGKTLRRTKDVAKDKKPLHLLSAFAHETGLVLAQQAVAEKSNEITAIPDLLEKLCIQGCIVTIDAMGTQKTIAHKIRAAEADYLLALKGNQSTLADDVRRYFADEVLKSSCASITTTDFGHGRIEDRRCLATQDIAWLTALHPEWSDLRSIAAIIATRTDKVTGTSAVETRYYITSLPATPATILAAARSHWSIENNLHWVMDVAFHDDLSRARDKNIALNFAVLKHAAFNMLKRLQEKLSIKSKRRRASLNNDFLHRCLALPHVNNL